MKVVIDENRCKGCALCTVACPKHLFKLSATVNRQGFHPARISAEDLELCTSCALCAQVCPDVAITIFRPGGQGGRSR